MRSRAFPDWEALASCAALPLDEVERMFFTPGPAMAQAQALCAACPVLRECRDAADHQEVGFLGDRSHMSGFRAGETVTQRIKRRRAAV